MRTKFSDFMEEVEAQAQAEGPEAVAQLAAQQRYFRAERQLAQGFRRKFTMALPEDLEGLASAFRWEGYQLYVVGGAVRDAVMGVKPKDFDVATDATPDQVIGLFELLRPIQPWQINEVGKSFGVVKAMREGGDHEYEIATFRQDIGVGRHPKSVVFTTIEEDVKRRDLTINALFYDIARQELVDLVGGLADIENRLVRAVGVAADRFNEDRLRVLRAIRFATTLGFEIEEQTFAAIVADNSLYMVSFERIHDEFTRIIRTAQSVPRLMGLLTGFNMWPQLLPYLRASACFDSLVSTSAPRSHNVAVVLAMLLDGEAEDLGQLAKCLNTLKYSAEEIAQITFLLRFRNLELPKAYKLRKLFHANHLTMETVLDYVFERGMPERAMASAFGAYLDAKPIDGSVLLAEGFVGRALGEELERRELETFRGLL